MTDAELEAERHFLDTGRLATEQEAMIEVKRAHALREYEKATKLQVQVDQAYHEERGLVVDPNETPVAPVPVMDAHAPPDTEQCEVEFARRALLSLAATCAVFGFVIFAIFCTTRYWDAGLIAAFAFIVGGVLLRVRRNL